MSNNNSKYLISAVIVLSILVLVGSFTLAYQNKTTLDQTSAKKVQNLVKPSPKLPQPPAKGEGGTGGGGGGK